jgi:RHS repeat-associated protein
MAYANPDAPTQIANGVSTTTFSYDADGNLAQKTVDGTTTTYVWDYANRLTALGVGNATTSYSYDALGNRVVQTGTSTTWIYPFKWVSVASSTGSGAQFATTTDYVFNGDSLVATIDQETASGNATGTARTKYSHPDHLGSTNVVTDDTGAVVQTLDYYPYGATRINSTSGNYSGAGRQYVNRFADPTLDYLNARYYDSSHGQFISQDPIFWSTQENLFNPQSLNSYSYANDNPITGKDPDGLANNSLNANAIISLIQQAIALIQQQINVISAGVSNGSGVAGTNRTNGTTPNNSPSYQWTPYSGTPAFGFSAPLQRLTPGTGAPLSKEALQRSIDDATKPNKLNHVFGNPDKEALKDMSEKVGGPKEFYRQLYSNTPEFPAHGSPESIMRGFVDGVPLEFTGKSIDGIFKLGTVYAPAAVISDPLPLLFIVPSSGAFYGPGTQI